jgi:3-isopropylmalate/(R)-2-methylmalate dehydratase large subunit
MTLRTLFDKVWAAHEVVPETAETPAILYVDLHLLHEVTSPQAFAVLSKNGLTVRRPKRVLATLDHSTPTRRDELLGTSPMRLTAAAE